MFFHNLTRIDFVLVSSYNFAVKPGRVVNLYLTDSEKEVFYISLNRFFSEDSFYPFSIPFYFEVDFISLSFFLSEAPSKDSVCFPFSHNQRFS